MPGPVSDSYDPEFGTAANADEIRDALASVYTRLSKIIGAEPLYIMDLVRADLQRPIAAKLTEKQWRLLRFAIERAKESI